MGNKTIEGLKVLFVCSGNSGKESIIVANQAASLRSAGVAVHIFLIKGSGIFGYLKNVKPLRKHLRNNYYDIIHAHYSFSGFVVSLSMAKPLIVSLMGSDLHENKIRKLLISVFGTLFRWRFIVVKSAQMRLRYRKLEIIPNGVDLLRFKPLIKFRCAEDEINACLAVAKPFGVKLQSMVFPGGTWGNIEALKKYDYTIYRRREDFELAYPYRYKLGLLVSPSSGCLEHNLEYGWSAKYFLWRLKVIINKAIATNTIAHLWFHPSLDPYFLENIFPAFFEFLSNERDKGELWIGTMDEIAKHINSKRVV